MYKLLEVYKKGGLNITKIHCDNKFCKVMDPFLAKKDLAIKMNYVSAQEYVPRDEQKNHVIQERVQAV